MAISPDFRKRIVTTDERIVIGHAAIIMQAHYDAMVIAEILCRVRVEITGGGHLAVSGGEKQITVIVEHHFAAIVAPADCLSRKDFHHIRQPVVLQTSANYRSG